MRLRAHMPAAAVVISIILLSGPIGSTAPTDRDWPAVSAATRPWTRWWWHGSAVDRRTLTSELEAFRHAGIGGVEITPIYGVRGAEDRFIPYLSDAWVQMLEHTLREARRLDLGVDMATGTGWPFGGPWVSDDDRSAHDRAQDVDARKPAPDSPNRCASGRRRWCARSGTRSTKSRAEGGRAAAPWQRRSSRSRGPDARPLQIRTWPIPWRPTRTSRRSRSSR